VFANHVISGAKRLDVIEVISEHSLIPLVAHVVPIGVHHPLVPVQQGPSTLHTLAAIALEASLTQSL